MTKRPAQVFGRHQFETRYVFLIAIISYVKVLKLPGTVYEEITVLPGSLDSPQYEVLNPIYGIKPKTLR